MKFIDFDTVWRFSRGDAVMKRIKIFLMKTMNFTFGFETTSRLEGFHSNREIFQQSISIRELRC